MELQGRLEKIRASGRTLVAISNDSPEALATFAREHGITFALLSDKDSRVITELDLLNREVKTDDPHFGIPHPGTLVLDEHRRVTARFFESSYRDRRTVASELLSLGDLLSPETAASSAANGLTLRAWSTDERVAPGTLFTLVLECMPAPGLHVYGPEQKQYRGISLAFPHAPDWLVFDAPQFPPTESYRFAPLNETVSAYRGAFRITRDVHIQVSKESAAALSGQSEVVLDGELLYQACSESECLLPQSVPVRWTVTLAPLVR